LGASANSDYFLRSGFVFYGEVEAGFCAGEGADDGGGGGFDGDGAGVSRGELKAVEEDGGALGVDAVAGEGGDEEGDGDLDGLDIFEWRQVEFEWCGFGQELVCSGCAGRGVGLVFDEDGGVFDQIFMAAVQAGVEVAEGGLAEGWGFAAASVGLDVAADRGLHFFWLLMWVHPLPLAGILGVSEMDAMV
jgi:hypothetical protein